MKSTNSVLCFASDAPGLVVINCFIRVNPNLLEEVCNNHHSNVVRKIKGGYAMLAMWTSKLILRVRPLSFSEVGSNLLSIMLLNNLPVLYRRYIGLGMSISFCFFHSVGNGLTLECSKCLGKHTWLLFQKLYWACSSSQQVQFRLFASQFIGPSPHLSLQFWWNLPV